MRLRDMASPPGFDSAAEIRRVKNWMLVTCACFLLFFTFSFFGNLGSLLSEELFVRWSDSRVMPLFSELTVLPRLCFLPMPCALVWLLVRNISYFRSSKSYYTMKRLPNRWEYPLRCALLPATASPVRCVSTSLPRRATPS